MSKEFWKADEKLRPILEMCLAPDSDVEKLLRHWEKNNAIEVIDGGLIRYIPYLYRRLLDLKIEPRDNYILRGAYFKSWWAHTVFQKVNLEFLSTLGSEFPEFALLKGVALQHSVYSHDQRTRPCEDIDILVNPRERMRAVDLLYGAGFKLDSVYSLKYVMNFRKSASFVRGDVSLDLNWGLYEYSRNPNFYEMLKFQSLGIESNQFRILSDTDNLIHTIIHGSGWNPTPSTRWILDAALLIKNGQIDWALFVEKVILNGWQYPLIDQIEYLMEYKIKIPSQVITSIKESEFDKFGIAMFTYQKQPSIWNRRLLRIAYADYLAFMTNNQKTNNLGNYIRIELRVLSAFLMELRFVYFTKRSQSK